MRKLRAVLLAVVLGGAAWVVTPSAHAATCDGGGPCDQLIAKVCHTPPLHCMIG